MPCGMHEEATAFAALRSHVGGEAAKIRTALRGTEERLGRCHADAAVLTALAPGTPLAGDHAGGAAPDGLEPRWQLAELAGRCTGDAHGLDSGRLAAQLVLRAAAAAHLPPPVTAAARAAPLRDALHLRRHMFR